MHNLNNEIFALVDCNNFYVSCERIFNPKLINKPVVVLSNNDGCFISRSNEAKALGIPMGAPYFEYAEICKTNNICVLSSNYRLYGEISNRIMNLLKEINTNIEVYSIDEAFLKLDNLPEGELLNFCQNIRCKIKQYIGVPVSIGIASTKTLAKVANQYAKQNKIGVFSVLSNNICNSILKNFDIKDIWGIGKNLNIKLKAMGINNAEQLKDVNSSIIRNKFGIVVEKTVQELRGLPCLDLETIQKNKKNIVTARSFGKSLAELYDIEEALSNYTATACAKMRNQNSKLQGICVFIVSNWHLKNQEFYKNSAVYYFDLATDNTIQVIKAAKVCLSKIYKRNHKYKKVGIILLDLIDNTFEQYSLLSSIHDEQRNSVLMKTIDSINNKCGKNTVFIASQGVERQWRMRAENKSPNFIGDWQQLITAH